MKFRKIANIFVLLVLVISSLLISNNNRAEASVSTYDLMKKFSSLAYLDARLEGTKLKKGVPAGWVFVEQVDDNYNPLHPAFKPWGAISSSFQATVFVNNKEKKLVVAFRGSQTDLKDLAWKDWQNNFRAVTSDDNVQAKNGHLYLNYLYNMKNKKYKNYKWYFTGHSLGGWLSQKLYFDAKTGKVYNNDKKKYKYYGKITKKDITAIVTFNSLPLTKYNVSKSTWDTMKKDTKVTNYVVKNEVLNELTLIKPKDFKYSGKVVYKDKKIRNLYEMGYSRRQLQAMKPSETLKFFYTNRKKISSIFNGHKLSNF
ncbi:DUF2974 domain-containing protein [Bacillus sp. sid0103]|uniref:DUF2974 domain-containing protein n=1 Tax=Bacillus sp. sid0103 TaxID=2856337 RepID=UPI001C4818B3|nr:DUF2974 domain-containing protein [Bacillus sp. sid0103]MBV7505077.1 DUF2974 domain-containing protein [Bacillus sp. sid0103]